MCDGATDGTSCLLAHGFASSTDAELRPAACGDKCTLHTVPSCLTDGISDLPIAQSGAQRKAAELGIALVVMDTSPRGLDIEGQDESYDLGLSASFYMNATVPACGCCWLTQEHCVTEQCNAS